MTLLETCQLTCPAGHDCRCVKFGAQYCGPRLADPETWNPLVVRMAERDRDVPAIPRPAGWTIEPPPPAAPLIAPPMPGVVRLGMATPALTIGGAERWTLSLLDATNSAPFRWDGIACYNRGLVHAPLVSEVERHCPVTWEYDGIAALARRVDLMFCWGLPFMVAAIKAANPACKVILVAHGICDWTGKAVAEAELADALAAVGKPSIRPFPADQQHRVKVIYNTTAARPATVGRDDQRRAWGLDPGRKVLLYLGRVSPEKYPEGAALAAAALPEPWSVVVVGPASDAYPWPVRPDDLPPGKLVFAGPTDDPGSALGAADAMLLPSWGEGFAIALIEAWHARVPVIGTVVGVAEECPDLLRPIPRGASGAAIAAAVLADQADPAGTAARAATAHAAATERFTFARFRDGWRALLLETCPPPPWATVADVGDGVFVTDAAHCDEVIPGFDRSIHIWRPENLPGGTCARVNSGTGPGMTVEYRENDPLKAMVPGLAEVVEYMRGPGRLLIHCHAGQCRAPTLAMLARIVRGADPDRAFAEVRATNIAWRGVQTDLPPAVLEDIRAVGRRAAKPRVAKGSPRPPPGGG